MHIYLFFLKRLYKKHPFRKYILNYFGHAKLNLGLNLLYR